MIMPLLRQANITEKQFNAASPLSVIFLFVVIPHITSQMARNSARLPDCLHFALAGRTRGQTENLFWEYLAWPVALIY